MREYVTTAIVLDVRPRGEFDKEAIFFSKELGKFRAMLVSGRKATSKFSPHCNPLNEVVLRIVHKNRYTVTDVLAEKSLIDITKGLVAKKAFLLTHFLERNLPDEVPDEILWEKLLSDFGNASFDFLEYISHFGYDVEHASCVHCGKMPVRGFLFNAQGLVCGPCSSKTNENELLLL